MILGTLSTEAYTGGGDGMGHFSPTTHRKKKNAHPKLGKKEIEEGIRRGNESKCPYKI